MKAIPLVLCCIILFSGCAPTTVNRAEQAEGAEIMAPADVLALVDRNTLFIHSIDEDSYLFFDHSGKLFSKDTHNNKDTGNWDVSEDGELCVRMRKWWYGDLRCFQVLASKKNLYLASSNGVLLYSAEQLGGDAKSLFHVSDNKKKSYRKSIRLQEQEDETAGQAMMATDEASPEQPSPEPEKSIIDESAYSPPARKDVRSTVKWMARDCPGCNLAESDLKNADLVGANLVGANLRRALLSKANLRRANMEGANLIAADLSYANLPGANLKNANLSGANLKGANLIRADLTGANIDGADFSGALLEGTTGLNN